MHFVASFLMLLESDEYHLPVFAWQSFACFESSSAFQVEGRTMLANDGAIENDCQHS